MEPFEDDRLVAALESLRPEPRPAFAAELDERAAGGFPRRGGSPLRRLTDRFRAFEPRRALVPAGATALAAVAAATVVISLSETSEERGNLSLNSSGAGSAGAGKQQASPARSGRLNFDGAGRYSKGSNNLYDADAPVAGLAQNSSSAASAAAEAVPQIRAFSRPIERSSGYLTRLRAHREIERSAQLVLGTEPDRVRKAASEVFETVHAYRGIVLDSSVRDGAEGAAGARFALMVPSARLGDAMADFSAIGEVRTRREATADITAPTVRTGELLRDSRATIEGLLTQLAAADTDAERAATEAKLRAERNRAANLRSQLSGLKRRANLSRVQLRIESGAPMTSSEGSGTWGVGDALGDAGRILAIAAGVSIVGLAVLGPIVLVALLIWLANRARVRRARQRALA
ncbi:MAG TPA: DUF4349 domain-containing protein [Solirubrobacterales bacterium]|nr:DUF4349 domain-containing protein [Solirubrobacterales bacterium]